MWWSSHTVSLQMTSEENLSLSLSLTHTHIFWCRPLPTINTLIGNGRHVNKLTQVVAMVYEVSLAVGLHHQAAPHLGSQPPPDQ